MGRNRCEPSKAVTGQQVLVEGLQVELFILEKEGQNTDVKVIGRILSGVFWMK